MKNRKLRIEYNNNKQVQWKRKQQEENTKDQRKKKKTKRRHGVCLYVSFESVCDREEEAMDIAEGDGVVGDSMLCLERVEIWEWEGVLNKNNMFPMYTTMVSRGRGR